LPTASGFRYCLRHLDLACRLHTVTRMTPSRIRRLLLALGLLAWAVLHTACNVPVVPVI